MEGILWVDPGKLGHCRAPGHTAMMHTYNHGDVFLPLLQEVLQELCYTAQGQVLKRVGDPMPQLQHVQPIPQSG